MMSSKRSFHIAFCIQYKLFELNLKRITWLQVLENYLIGSTSFRKLFCKNIIQTDLRIYWMKLNGSVEGRTNNIYQMMTVAKSTSYLHAENCLGIGHFNTIISDHIKQFSLYVAIGKISSTINLKSTNYLRLFLNLTERI